MTDRKLMQQALDALESISRYGLDTLSGRIDGPDDRNWQRAAVVEMTNRAMRGHDALRARLAQPEPEPVAWQSRMRPDWEENGWTQWKDCTKEQACDFWKRPHYQDWIYEARALYTAPPQREFIGLTDEEIHRAYNDVLSQPMREQDKTVVFNVCRTIEAKLREKNT